MAEVRSCLARELAPPFSHSSTSPSTDRNRGCGSGDSTPLSSPSHLRALSRSFFLRCSHSNAIWPSVTSRAQPCRPPDLRRVEMIAAPLSFNLHFLQVFCNVLAGIRRILKTLQLRMVLVAARLASQHGLRQQRLAPQRHEPLPVKVFGMQRPQSHRFLSCSLPAYPRLASAPAASGHRVWQCPTNNMSGTSAMAQCTLIRVGPS